MPQGWRYTALTKLFRLAVWLFAGACIVWWLFSDTLAHYQAPRTDRNTIRFAHFGSYEDYKLWRCIIATFQAANPDIHIQQEYVPGWYGRYDTKIRQQILSGTLPHVVLMQMGPFPNVARHFALLNPYLRNENDSLDIMAELDATAAGAFRVGGIRPAYTSRATEEYESALSSLQHRGPAQQLRGIPIAGGSLLIYCNPDCFAAASAFHGKEVPLPDDDWTLEEFASVARRLTCDFDRDGRLDQWGFWLPRWVYYLPFIWSFGADVLDGSESRWALTGPKAEEAFTFYRDLARDRRVCPKPAEVPQLIQDVGFLTGKVAMCVNGPWFQPFLARTRLRQTYRVVHMPRGRTGHVTRVTWDGLCMADDLTDAEKRKAWRFVRFCVSPAAQKMIAQSGRALPARRGSMPLFDHWGADARRRKFVEALSYSRLGPRMVGWSEIDRAIGWHLQRFVADDSEMSTSQFLAALARDRAIVGEFGEVRGPHSSRSEAATYTSLGLTPAGGIGDLD